MAKMHLNEPIEKHVTITELSPSDIHPSFSQLKSGIMFIPEETADYKKAYSTDMFDFIKYLRTEKPGIQIHSVDALAHIRHSSDIWIPLVLIAQDTTVQVFLGLLVNYIYDCIKGSLKNDNTTVHFSTEYINKKSGVVNKLVFSGSLPALKEVLKHLNEDDVDDK